MKKSLSVVQSLSLPFFIASEYSKSAGAPAQDLWQLLANSFLQLCRCVVQGSANPQGPGSENERIKSCVHLPAWHVCSHRLREFMVVEWRIWNPLTWYSSLILVPIGYMHLSDMYQKLSDICQKSVSHRTVSDNSQKRVRYESEISQTKK